MDYQIVNISERNDYRLDAARILSTAFNDLGNDTWPDITSAIQEVDECIDGKNLCIGILIDNSLVGWVGLRPLYKTTWELHPLVVKTEWQGKGIGSILLSELEMRAKQNGLIGMVLGTDDEHRRTSLSSIDITEENIFKSITNIRNLNNHPYEFYKKMGFFIVGIIPNANGKNKPDIWMWKNLVQE